MPTQEHLTMRQVRTIREDGEAEIVPRGALIQPGQHSFASQDELNAYLVETLGAKAKGGGIGGSLSRKGFYARRSADGNRTVTFGDPVLDAVSSAAGTLVIGGQSIDLMKGHPSRGRAGAAGGGTVIFGPPALKLTGIVHDAERWATDDESYVEYRIRNGRLAFHAWKDNYTVASFGYWSMGLEISVSDTATNFEAAAITAAEYMSVDAPCQMFPAGGSGVTNDFNDSHVDLSDWGIHAQQPERVAGICQAQWHHRQFSDLVTAGGGCLRYKADTWPTIFPTDWTMIVTAVPLNGSWTDGSGRSAPISVTRRSFSIDMSAFGRPTAHGTVDGFSDISATFPDDKTYKGQLTEPNLIRWSNGSRWTKIVNTVFDLNGTWSDGGPWVAMINEGPASLVVDMSDFDRPTAEGKIIDSSTITVTFPDDHTYTGTLVNPKTIKWSNGSTWTKR